MKKQFDLLAQFSAMFEESRNRINKIQEEIDREYSKIKLDLLDIYDHDAEVLYLVKFQYDCLISFYRATKTSLCEVDLSWYNSKRKMPSIPKTYDEAVIYLKNMNDPTKCEVRDYQEFGYFDDVNKRWERIDWIAENIFEKKFLYEITEKEFLDAVEIMHKFFLSRK